MIAYKGTKKQFDQDVLSGKIASKVRKELLVKGVFHDNESEYRSWENSLREIQDVLNSPDFSDDIQIAVEYQIPLTSKRIDFMIAGADYLGKDHIVIVELKQWTKAVKSTANGIVKTFVDGAVRGVAHPSYQAYTYAKLIEDFNTSVQQGSIGIHSCAYLHNLNESSYNELTAPMYKDVLDSTPVFIKSEKEKFLDFIKQFVARASRSDLLYEIDNSRIKPSKSLQDTVVSMVSGNKEFMLIDGQKIVYETIRNLVYQSQSLNKKYTVIVEGGAGTGKSVVAMQLLSDFIANGKSVNYVTKNKASRNVFLKKLKQGNALNDFVGDLFKSSVVFNKCAPNSFDILIVDEAHRLNENSKFGGNQIEEIIKASRVNVFFVDEDQIVTAKDIGTVEEIKKWAIKLGSKVYSGKQYNLTSQFRCNGSDGYIAFLDDFLGIRPISDFDGFDLKYNIEIIDDPNTMREILRSKNDNNKARMVAGYCYEWISRYDSKVYDIILENGFKAQWNIESKPDDPNPTWAIDDSFDEIGCIHTAQGLEFDYIGVIIGNDLRYENGRVLTDPSKRAKSDFSLNGLETRSDYKEAAAKIIRNTYKTLLTRAQRGCYVYCENKALQNYLKNRILNLR